MADSVGAHRIATGHYARVRYDEASGRYQLLRARDGSKDQTYFLFGLTQKQLARTLFPLGEICLLYTSPFWQVSIRIACAPPRFTASFRLLRPDFSTRSVRRGRY